MWPVTAINDVKRVFKVETNSLSDKLLPSQSIEYSVTFLIAHQIFLFCQILPERQPFRKAI